MVKKCITWFRKLKGHTYYVFVRYLHPMLHNHKLHLFVHLVYVGLTIWNELRENIATDTLSTLLELILEHL